VRKVRPWWPKGKNVDTIEQKTERNCRVQARYDELMQQGKHGHYETMFRVVREEVEAERERCAKIVDMPPGTEAWEVIGGEEGLTMLREFAVKIRGPNV
jgi:hypothetical protein